MKKSHRFHHRKMCKRGYRRKQSRLYHLGLITADTVQRRVGRKLSTPDVLDLPRNL